ncbi:SDR family NAD(P)-dependent oxidoreductase [Candidatus Laterigemmans baculatus]|uniref:SDR family NAD(P)-dependent oxidoreductase n=1 Tax=Candidatus Laterigemmans baculatus TaxID=2770505 RepID=UPI0013DA766F|nr:SDR family oxidoreductase [Candidatus Laterigemmans baculatus]
MTGPLKGKRALITGASLGIGRGTAIELARAGADVAINYRSHADEAESVREECERLGGKAVTLQADMGDRQQAEEIVGRAAAALGGLDIVVSNAVYSDRQLFYEADLDEFHKTLDVTMWGAFYLTRAAALEMIQGGSGGNIVVISSPHAVMAIPGSMAYNMAKAAIDQMARTAAVELAEHRIRVNIIHPGWIDTPGERKFFSEETLREQGSKLPWGRLGRPEEIGRGVAFLCDPSNEYITGSTLTIDGGIQLPWREMYRIREKPDQ